MKGSASALLKFLDGSSLRFVIPVYQRNYDWKHENCRQLFDDLLAIIRDNKQSHFFGSIVSYNLNRSEVCIIDGQQRITTVSLILIAIINAIKNGDVSPDSKSLSNRIEETYIIDKYSEDERKVRLKPFRNDCNAFDALVSNDKDKFINESKVTTNYKYFYDRIVNEKISPDDLFEAVEKLEIIDIELEPSHGDDPQLIFESLNSTGLDLTEADKIRNFILMGLDTKLQERFYDNYWSKIESLCGSSLDIFVRNYLSLYKSVIPNIKRIYFEFKDYTRSSDKSIEEILQDMLLYARAYNRIVSCDLDNPKVNEIAKRLNLLDLTVAHTFLMAFVVYADEQQLPASDVRRVFEIIETFIFRRAVCDMPSNALLKIFASLHRVVLKYKTDEFSYSSVMTYILENRRSSVIFPRDEEFSYSFVHKDIYNMRGQFKPYIFDRLENFNTNEINDVFSNMSKRDNPLTIEHIMPQTLTPEWINALGEDAPKIHETWLHTIANLTLTGYNSYYSNRSFAEKKTLEHGFNDSGLRLNKYIAKFDKWTVDELTQRAHDLLDKALKIWQYPSTDFKTKEVIDEVVTVNEDNDFFTNRVAEYFIFNDKKVHVTTWADLMLQFANILYSIDPSVLYKRASDKKDAWFSTAQKSSRWKELGPDLWFMPSESSTWNKIAIIKHLLEEYGFDYDDFAISLRPTKNDDDLA